MDAISKQDKAVESIGDKGILIDGRLLKQDDIIYDLVDVITNNSDSGSQRDQEVIVIDGKVYERVSSTKDSIVELTDVIEEGHHDEVFRRISEITERIAREIIPDIAERVIKEEIEKLKG